MKKILIGSRASKLSLVYANKVKKLILEKESDLPKENIIIKTIKTSGDIFKDRKLSEIGGKKLFCKEIEESLLQKKSRYSSTCTKRYGSPRRREFNNWFLHKKK